MPRPCTLVIRIPYCKDMGKDIGKNCMKYIFEKMILSCEKSLRRTAVREEKFICVC